MTQPTVMEAILAVFPDYRARLFRRIPSLSEGVIRGARQRDNILYNPQLMDALREELADHMRDIEVLRAWLSTTLVKDTRKPLPPEKLARWQKFPDWRELLARDQWIEEAPDLWYYHGPITKT